MHLARRVDGAVELAEMRDGSPITMRDIVLVDSISRQGSTS